MEGVVEENTDAMASLSVEEGGLCLGKVMLSSNERLQVDQVGDNYMCMDK